MQGGNVSPLMGLVSRYRLHVMTESVKTQLSDYIHPTGGPYHEPPLVKPIKHQDI